MIKVNITFQTVTEESAEHGDFSDQGFIEEDMEFETKEEALEYFGDTYGFYEKGNDTDYYTVDPDIDYDDGSQTTYGLHF
jgi:hypothetical protein